MITTPSSLLRKTAWVCLCFLFTACGPRDTQIATQAISAVQAIDSGVTVQVSQGVATISGDVKDRATQLAVEAAVNQVKGVQTVNNKTTIKHAAQPSAPQVLDADKQLKQHIDSSLEVGNIRGVHVAVSHGEVTLTGQAPTDDLAKIMEIVDHAGPEKIINQVVVDDSTYEEPAQ